MTTPHHSGSGDLSRSMELLWRGRERPSRGPKPALSLDRIVAAAVAIADREGLGALSMRKVAAELGVGTMSLYRYVPGKGELLDLMLDHVEGPGDELERHRGLGWRAAMELVAHGIYELYTRHPWLLQVNQARPLLGPNAMAGFDFALAALDGLGLTGRERVAVITAVDAYVTGVARGHVQQREVSAQSGVSDEEFWAAQGPILESAMRSGRYPAVFALPEDAFGLGGREMLDFGLARLLDGLAAFIERVRRERPTDTEPPSCAPG